MNKRSVLLYGHRTSIALEDEFWDALGEIARLKKVSRQTLLRKIDVNRGDPKNLTRSLRIYILDFYRKEYHNANHSL